MAKVPPRITGSPQSPKPNVRRTKTDAGVRIRTSKDQPARSSGSTRALGDDEHSDLGVPREVTGARLPPIGARSGDGKKGTDKFDLLKHAEALVTEQKLPPPGPLLPPSHHRPGSAMEALDNAQPPGVFFKEDEREGERGDEEDDELAAAVEEAIRLLFGVRGIHRISPGLNQQGQKVVLISVARGFDEESLKSIPAMVLGFPTLVALPYELLPLRRVRI